MNKKPQKQTLDSILKFIDKLNETDSIEDNFEDLLEKMLALSEFSYEKSRNEIANKLSIRAVKLDSFLTLKKQKQNKQNQELFKKIEPHSQPVNAQKLIDEVYEIVSSVVIADEEVKIAVCLWILMTWCYEEFDIAPIACITAPEKRCGKTVLLSLMSSMVQRPINTSFLTPTVVFRAIEEYKPTLLIDEADAFFKKNEELRGVVNMGHSKHGGYVLRCETNDYKIQSYKVFCPKVISGIGALPDTLNDRSIVLKLKRKMTTEKTKRLKDFDDETFGLICSKLLRWSTDNKGLIGKVRIQLPDALNDRQRDNWEPLLIIASMISENWLSTAIQSAIKLSKFEDSSVNLSEMLIADIKEVFNEKQCEDIYSKHLLEALTSQPEKPWGSLKDGKPISSHVLAKELKSFGIKSKNIRTDTSKQQLKGYSKSDFKDVFERYT